MIIRNYRIKSRTQINTDFADYIKKVKICLNLCNLCPIIKADKIASGSKFFWSNDDERNS